MSREAPCRKDLWGNCINISCNGNCEKDYSGNCRCVHPQAIYTGQGTSLLAQPRPQSQPSEAPSNPLQAHKVRKYEEAVQEHRRQEAAERKRRWKEKAERRRKEKAEQDRQEKAYMCVICQENFGRGQRPPNLCDNCSHKYHLDCLNKQLRVRNKCPICSKKCKNAYNEGMAPAAAPAPAPAPAGAGAFFDGVYWERDRPKPPGIVSTSDGWSVSDRALYPRTLTPQQQHQHQQHQQQWLDKEQQLQQQRRQRQQKQHQQQQQKEAKWERQQRLQEEEAERERRRRRQQQKRQPINYAPIQQQQQRPYCKYCLGDGCSRCESYGYG